MADRKMESEHIELNGCPDTPSPGHSTTWGNDVLQRDARPKRRRSTAWALAMDSTKQRAQTFADSTSSYWRHTPWPAVEIPFKRVQFYAFCLVLVFGVTPFIIIAQLTLNDNRAFYGVFAAKSLSCGDAFGTPQNSTVKGWEALFVLDSTFGRFQFSQAKTLDVAWDILMGRGAQMLAWWASYKVFTDALLRVIERHPTSYQTFAHICLEGPCLASMWALIKDLGRIKSKRTWSLYFYMVISVFYTLCIPLFLSAMTGYISTTVAWVDADGTDNLIPAAAFNYNYLAYNAGNTTFNQTCVKSYSISPCQRMKNLRPSYCDCQLPNGTVFQGFLWEHMHYYNSFNPNGYDFEDCNYRFPNNTKTFNTSEGDIYQCNQIWNITIQGHEYDCETLNYTTAYCHNGKGYPTIQIEENTRCLPDTANEAYQWGFSSMLSGVWIIINFFWVLTMYAVWQDAQFYSELVKSGYGMTQLRAAFTLATAARWRTGMGNRELVRTDTRNLESQLYGSKTKNRAEIVWDIFGNELKDPERSVDERGLRQRNRRTSDGDT